MSLEKKLVESHYTDFGELQFYDGPNPHFVFFNAKAVKKDIVIYYSTMKNLANALQTAQSVCKRFNAVLEESGLQTAEVPEERDQRLLKVLEQFKEDVHCSEMDAIFWKELTDSYGNDVQMKMVLMANVYRGRTHIWLKPLWQDIDKTWRPTMRGFQFSTKDDAKEMMRFVNRHMALRERRESRKEPPLPPVQAAADTEVAVAPLPMQADDAAPLQMQAAANDAAAQGA